LAKPREWEVWTKCDKCNDMADIVFWIRKTPSGNIAKLEKSTTASYTEGKLIHRPDKCGGNLRLYQEMPPNTILDD
jgi:hypothetical protein